MNKLRIALTISLLFFTSLEVFAVTPPCRSARECAQVPEIDATGTMPALMVLAGVLALKNEKRRRK